MPDCEPKFEPLTWLRAVCDETCSLDSSESLVMLALIKHADESGYAWPSVGLLLRETRVGHTKATQCLTEFEARGLLVRSRPRSAGDVSATQYFAIPEERRPSLYRLPLLPPTEGLRGERRVVRHADPSKREESASPLSEPVRHAEGGSSLGEPHPVRQAEGRGSPGGYKLLSELLTGTAQLTAQAPTTPKAPKVTVGEKRSKQGRVAKWRRVPDAWQASAAHREQAKGLGVNFELELAKFRDHEFKDGKSDADAAFRNWLRTAGDRSRGPQVRGRFEPQRGIFDERMLKGQPAEWLNGGSK